MTKVSGRQAATASQQGFTLVELIVSMVLTVMFSALVLGFSFDFWRASTTTENDLYTYGGRLTAGDRLRDLVDSASGLIDQNSLADSHVLAGDPADTTGNYWQVIHAIPGTIQVGGANSYTPVMYLRAPATDTSKNVAMNGTQPFENEFILYLDGSKQALRMRTLANPNVASNRAVTSCPDAQASASCPADAIIAQNLASVSTRYFSRSGNTIDYTSITDPLTGAYAGPDFPAVEVVELTLNTTVKATVSGSANTSNQTIIRVALRN